MLLLTDEGRDESALSGGTLSIPMVDLGSDRWSQRSAQNLRAAGLKSRSRGVRDLHLRVHG